MKVMLVGFQVLSNLRDSPRQYCDLNIGRARVLLVDSVLLNDIRLSLSGEGHEPVPPSFGASTLASSLTSLSRGEYSTAFAHSDNWHPSCARCFPYYVRVRE